MAVVIRTQQGRIDVNEDFGVAKDFAKTTLGAKFNGLHKTWEVNMHARDVEAVAKEAGISVTLADQCQRNIVAEDWQELRAELTEIIDNRIPNYNEVMTAALKALEMGKSKSEIVAAIQQASLYR